MSSVSSYNWTGLAGDGSWSDSANWDVGLVPVAGAVVTLSAAGSSYANYDDGTNPGYQSVVVESTDPWSNTGNPVLSLYDAGNTFTTVSLTLGDTAGYAGLYNQSSGSLDVTDTALIGNAGIGFLDLSGGIANIGQLVLGSQAGSQGSVALTTGATLNDDSIIGDAGSGSFTNSDATDNVSGNLVLGNQVTGSGSYTITGSSAQTVVSFVPGGNSGAPVNVNGANANANGAVVIGNFGTGSFTQGFADGSDPNNQVSIAGDLVLGLQGLGDGGAVPDSAGTYTLNDGTLTVGGKLVVGAVSTGTNGANQFIQSGGTVNLTGSASGNPDYTGVGNNNSVDSILIGGGGGNIDYGTGEYILNDGSVTASIIEVGHSGTGTFTQNGGTVTATYTLWVANATGSIGTYTLASGTLNASYGGEQVGLFGTGTFNQSGGINSDASALSVGSGAVGTYTMTGGVLNANNAGNGSIGLTVGDAGTGIFNQVTGTVTSGVAGTSRADVLIGAQAGASGTYNLGDATNGAPTLQIYGDTTLGRDAGATGTLAIAGNGTTLSVNQYTGSVPQNGGNILVGLNGTGTVTQTDASTVYSDHNMVLGANAGSSGTYTLSATSLGGSPDNLFVGSDLNIGGMTSLTDIYGDNFQTTPDGGTGVFNLESGDVGTAGAVNVGNNDGSGTLAISGGTLTAGTGMNVGVNDLSSGGTSGGSGTVTQTAGVVTLGNAIGLALGITANTADQTTGSYTITGTATAGSSVLNDLGNAVIGDSGTGIFTQGLADGSDTGITVNVAGDLVLGVQGSGVGSYTLNSGLLTVGGQLAVGGTSQNDNEFYQNGGTLMLANTASSNPDYVPVGGAGFDPWGGALAIGGGIGTGNGSNSGGTGTYTLNGGVISTYNLLVGPTGTGTFNQSGGAVTTTYFTLGFSGTGSYNLANGTLQAYSEAVGYAGTGTFAQSGGSNTITASLAVGSNYPPNSPASGTSTYYLTGGTLTSGNTTIGQGEQGDFVNTGASDSISGNLVVGDQSIPDSSDPTINLGTGTYTITGDSATLDIAFVSGGNGAADPAGSNGYLNNDPTSTPNPAPNGALIVGQFGTGTFTQGLDDQSDTGNSVTVAGDLVLGSQSGSQGQYTLNTGTLTVGGKLEVGRFSVNSNLFTQNGGTVSVTGLASGDTDYVGVGGNVWSGWLEVGGDISELNGGSGAYALNGGTISASGIVVGASGVGTFTQTGGAATAYNVYLGADGGGFNGIGTYSLSAGTLNASYELDGGFGVGTFDQSGGTNTAGTLDIANGPNYFAAGTPSRQGDYTLSGGLLLAGNLTDGDGGVGNFYQTGGLVTVGQWFGGQVYPDGSVAPDGPNGAGSGTVGTLVVGAQAGGNATTITGYNGAGSVGIYDLGLTGQTNAAAWGGYPFSPGTAPPTFDNGVNAPYLQVYGNVVIGRDGAGVAANGGSPQPYDAASGTFNLAGDGSVLQINNVVGTTNNGTMVVGLNGIGTFNQQDNTTVYLDGSLAIGLNDGSTGIYTLNAGDGAGTLSVGSNLNIGGSPEVGTPTAQTTTNAGTGTFNQNAGTVSVAGNLNIATNQNASGTYDLAGGSLTVANDGYVGNNGGTGTVNQTGGAATFGSDSNPGGLLLGTTPAAGPASIGTYDLTGDASTLTVDGNVDLGVAQNATGNLVVGTGLDTPTLAIDATSASGFTDGNLTIGDAGTGSLTLNSGTVTAAGYLTLGASGQGTLTLNAGSLTVAATTYVGGGATGTAAVVQDGGSFETGYLDIGFYSPSGATYDLYAGSLTVDNDLVLGSGFSADSSGDFTQHGGTVAVNSGSYGIYINNNSVYSLLSGSLATAAGLTVGDNSGTNAQVLQSGGTATIGNDLIVGNGAGIGGSYTLSGSGQLTVGSAATTGFADIGEFGTGTFTQDGTASSATIYGSLDVGRFAGGTGTVNLDAGSLTVADGFAVVGDSGTGFFNQGGASTLTVGSGGLAIGRGESNAGGGAPITGTGTFTLTGTASLTVTGGIALGVLAGNAGTFTQTGGSVTADNEVIGDGGTGQWNQSAGTNTVSGSITIGITNTGTYAMAGGSVTADSIAVDAQGSITGFGTIGGGAITDDGSISASTGDLIVNNELAGSGLLSIGSGATLDLAGTVGALSLTFTAPGTAETLAVGQALGMDASITGFAASDLVVFSNLAFAGTDTIGSYAGGLLTIVNASDATIATLTIAPPPSGSFQLTDSGGNLAVIDVVCFAEGTRILTDHGEVAVEALDAGDRVMTLDGASRPIVWIGQRWIDVASHPRPDRVLPIRIRRGAFAEQVPHNDLLVSPDHAIFVDGLLIPARLLVNGATIFQDASVRGIRYFHVELDRHDVILAEGLPSESYLDTGNRAIFANAGLALVLHPDFSIQERLQSWQDDACAPLTVDESHVHPIWQRLAARAGLTQDGLHPTQETGDPELRLLVNGRMLKPIVMEEGRHLFALPRFGGPLGGEAGTWRATLLSRSARPSDTRPWLDDGRRLGVAVQGIAIRGGDEYRRLPVDHPDLREGWWAVERLGNALWRWTDGSAAIDLPEGTDIVEVTIAGGMTYPVAKTPEAGRLAA